MKDLIIFGAGQIAEIANFYFKRDSEDNRVTAFCVDSEFLKESKFEGLPVLSFEEIQQSFSPDKVEMFIALSYTRMNRVREIKYSQAKEKGYKLASYISTRCHFISQYPCGDNCFILEDNTIQPFVRIGSNVTLWSGNHIGHHSVIDDHNFVSSHVVISGNCHINSNCFLGVNATIHNNVVIENECLIGAGAVISKATVKKGVYLPPKSSLFNKASDEIDF